MRLGSTSALLVVARHAHCIAALIKQLFPLPCQRRQVARRPPWESLYQLRYKSLTIRVKQGHNEQSQKPEKPRNARRTIYPTATTPPQPPHRTRVALCLKRLELPLFYCSFCQGRTNPFTTWLREPQTPLKQVCLAIAWLGTGENTAFGDQYILASQHDVSTPKSPWN